MQIVPDQINYLPVTPQRDDPVVSPSQIKTWNDCPRKWAFEKVDKLPVPSSPEAERGTRVHALLEDWIKYGRPPPEDTLEGVIARKLLPFAPPPGAAEAEGDFAAKYLGIAYRGIKDLVYRESGRLVVHDWKTTSDLKWAISEDDILSDPQGLIYALDALDKTGANEVALRWVYGTATKRPRTRVVERVVRRDEVQQAFLEHVHVPATRIVRTKRQITHAMQLRGNPRACHKYRGCPFLKSGACKLTRQERLEALMEHDALRNRLAEQQQQTNGHVQQPTPVPPHLIRQAQDGNLLVATSTGEYAPVYQGQDGAYYTNPGIIPQEPPQALPGVQSGPVAQPAQKAAQPAQAPQGFPTPSAPVQPLAMAAPVAQAPAQASQPSLPGVQPTPVAQAPAQAAVAPQPTHNPADINQPVSQAPVLTSPSAEELAAQPETPKRTRKASTSKSKSLTLDQQVWLAGAAEAAGRVLDPAKIVQAGNALISAFHQRFGD